MTPSGVATRSKSSPFGVVQWASTRPTGSARPAIASTPSAIASTRASSRTRRSRKAGVWPAARACGDVLRHWRRGCAASARRSSAAMARKAPSFCAAGASAKARAAARAALPEAAHRPGDLVIDAAPVVGHGNHPAVPATVTPSLPAPVARSQASGPSNRAMSSRWIISERPRKPRTSSMARLLRPAMRTASPTS